MSKYYIKAHAKKVTSDGLLTGIVGSTAAVDRYGEIVNQESWNLDHYKNNPVILWAHNLSFTQDQPPIGKAVRIEVERGKGLVFDIQFDMKDPFAADIARKYKEGFLNAFSVGFISHARASDDDGNTILLENELLELSAVPVPANPEALQALKQRSFAVRSWESLLKTMEQEDQEAEPQPETITNTDSLGESGGGEEKREATPTKTSLGGDAQAVAVIREATRQLQEVLRHINSQQRAAR